MTERSSRKQRKLTVQARLLALLALLGALAVHALLFFAFRIELSTGTPAMHSNEPASIFVTPLGDGDLADWERDVHHWALLGEPTLMSLPNRTLGFSTVRPMERPHPVTDAPLYTYELTFMPEETFPPFWLSSPLPSLAEELARIWLRASPPRPEAPPITRIPRGLFWRRPDGTLLPDAPAVDEAAVREAIKQGNLPRYPTRIELSRDTDLGYTRIRVRTGCGNSSLDQLVVDALRAIAARSDLMADFGTIPIPIPDFWPPEGNSVTIEVEWSFLPDAMLLEQQ